MDTPIKPELTPPPVETKPDWETPELSVEQVATTTLGAGLVTPDGVDGS
jgi:hypothetical protein